MSHESSPSNASDRPSESQLPGQSRLGRLIAFLVATRLIVLVFAGAGWFLAEQGVFPRHPEAQWPLLVWDGLHYHDILTNGYPDEPSKLIAFFPGYPLAAWPLAQIMPAPVAMVILSNVAVVGGWLLAYVWARRHVDEPLARRGIMLAACFPTAVFCSAAYTEGLAILTLGGVLALLPRSTFGAALISAVGTSIRPTMLVAPLVIFLARLRQDAQIGRPGRGLTVGLLAGAVGAMGGLGYQAYLTQKYDDFWVFRTAQKSWERAPVSASFEGVAGQTPQAVRLVDVPSLPPEHLGRLILLKLDNPAAWNLVWGPALLVVVGVSLIRPGPIPREYLLIGLVIAIMGLGPGTGARVASLARFEVIALPTFVYLAWLLRTRGRLWAGVALVMFLFQMMYAFRLAPGKEFGG